MQVPLSIAAMISFFALCLSCINAGGRIIFAMGRHGLFHSATAGAHHLNATPHVAVSILGGIALTVPVLCTLADLAPLDIFGYVGTLAAFGFLMSYLLITLSAPVYLAKLSQRRPVHMAICAISLALLVIPAVGSVYPMPPPPVTYFPYLFLAYLVVGVAWILRVRRRKPDTFVQIQQDLDLAHAKHQAA